MKVTVTHLKAPWPAGTEPGHVVELAGLDSIPGWAQGKCKPADDNAEANATLEPKPPEPAKEEPKPETPPGVTALIAEAVKPLEAKLAEQAAAIESLKALVPAAVGELIVNPASEGEKPAAGADAPAAGKKKPAAGA